MPPKLMMKNDNSTKPIKHNAQTEQDPINKPSEDIASPPCKSNEAASQESVITADNLKMGDIIFYLDTMGMAEHVALYITEKKEIHYIVHATTSPHRGISLTYLREADLGCNYQIVRPLDENLSHVALGIVLQWVEEKIPFASEQKNDALLNAIDEKNGYMLPQAGRIQSAHAKETYTTNYMRYLDMANALPSTPKIGGEVLGLSCSETLVAAFNIALLLRNATYSADVDAPFSLPVPMSAFIETLENPFPFDSATIQPAGMLHHCLKTIEHWMDMGILENYHPRPPSPQAKSEWKIYQKAFMEAIKEKQTTRERNNSLEILVPHNSPRRGNRTGLSPLTYLDSPTHLEASSPSRSPAHSVGSPLHFLNYYGIQEREVALSKKTRPASEPCTESREEHTPSVFYPKEANTPSNQNAFFIGARTANARKNDNSTLFTVQPSSPPKSAFSSGGIFQSYPEKSRKSAKSAQIPPSKGP